MNRRQFLQQLFWGGVVLTKPTALGRLIMPQENTDAPLIWPLLPDPVKEPLPVDTTIKPRPLTRPNLIKPKSRLLPITFYNIHTDKWLKNFLIPATGPLDPDIDHQIRQVFMDHRAHQTHKIDIRLLRLIQRMMMKMQCSKPIHLCSGYRSPQTNAYLRRTTTGVEKNSYHTKGMAADIYIEGIHNHMLQHIALKIRGGGVGRYTQFVHVDCGPIRRWGLPVKHV